MTCKTCKTIGCVVLTAALGVLEPASADFAGWSVEAGPQQHPEAGVVTWRVHLRFDNPTDVVLAVGGIPNVGEIQFQTDGAELRQNCAVSAASCVCDTASSFDQGGDSWVNLGETLDVVGSLACDCPGCCIAGSSFGAPCVEGYFNPSPGTPIVGGEVLIAQFSLPSGTCFSYRGVVNWQGGFANGFTSSPFDVEFCGCQGDLDGSGAVDFTDLVSTLAAWGPVRDCPPHTPADLDKDCHVGFADLVLLLSRWGACK